MIILPTSEADKAKLLDLFVDRIHGDAKKNGGRVYGTYQILTMLEEISTENGLITCPYCGCKARGRS